MHKIVRKTVSFSPGIFAKSTFSGMEQKQCLWFFPFSLNMWTVSVRIQIFFSIVMTNANFWNCYVVPVEVIFVCKHNNNKNISIKCSSTAWLISYCLLSRKYPKRKVDYCNFCLHYLYFGRCLMLSKTNIVATSVNGNMDDMHRTVYERMCFLRVKLCLDSFNNCSTIPSIH